MKTTLTIAIASAALLALSIPAAAQGRGNGPGTGTGVVAVEPLTTEEAKTLAFMREEEKLARDVYTALAAKWDLTVFRNIAQSEDQHFKAIGAALVRYKTSDPAENTAAGVFVDGSLNALYAQLMAKGMLSVKDALEVGVAIEKVDIQDLEDALKTTKADLKRMYANLLNASLSHQEAFETNLEVACAQQ